jgi:hypothetical protein
MTLSSVGGGSRFSYDRAVRDRRGPTREGVMKLEITYCVA